MDDIQWICISELEVDPWNYYLAFGCLIRDLTADFYISYYYPKYPSNGFTSVHLSFRPTEFHFRILLLERSSSGKYLGEEIRNESVWKSRFI